MADISINSAADLHAEIARLKLLRAEQETAIHARFSSPSAIFSTIISLFKADGSRNHILGQDLFGVLSRILLPLTLNKTIFRNSNFIIKGLVGFLSQKASHFVNEDNVMGFWHKITALFDKKTRQQDYGIPPESEAS
jgi:hypothetical protein